MTSEMRGELFRALEGLCQKYPHWRFGQLVSNIAGWADADIWDVEDSQLLEAIRQYHAYQKSSASTPAATDEVA